LVANELIQAGVRIRVDDCVFDAVDVEGNGRQSRGVCLWFNNPIKTIVKNFSVLFIQKKRSENMNVLFYHS
jgi:hypothetical protein